MELIKHIEAALRLSKRQRLHFLTCLLTMAFFEAGGSREPPPHNDNHHDEHEADPH